MTKPITALTDIRPQTANANQHTPRGMGELERSIQQDGWIGAITVAADGETFDGSARVEVGGAAFDGVEPIVVESDGSRPVVLVRKDIPSADDPRARRLGIAANRVAELNLSWDASVLDSLIGEGIDLSTLFRDGELPIVVEEPAAKPEDDDAPTIDLDKPTRVQPGDVWRVGAHLVCCLDSRDKGLVSQWARGVTFVVADPPYGVKAVGKDGRIGSDYSDNKTPGYERFKGYSANVYAPVIGDETTDTAVDAALLALELFPRVAQVWWGANHYAQALPPSSCWVVWDKENDGDDFPDAELAWVNHKGAVRVFRHMWKGMLRASEVQDKRVHPTQKPVALFLWLYERYGKPGDVIFDPFLGSGPSLKAAHRMGDRTVIGFELAPAYCDHILEWGAAQGLTCERLTDA